MFLNKSKSLFLCVVFFVSIFVALFYTKNLGQPDSRGLLFVTVGLDQSKLPNESSSYEIQRASEHFSDLLLGWTLDPSFGDELNMMAGYKLKLTAQRQEKQNLLFYLSASKENFNSLAHESLLKLLNSRISEYDAATNSGYLIAFSKYTALESYRNDFRVGIGIVLVSLISGLFLLIIWDYAKKMYCHRFKSTH